jgi:hypothetical protein
MLNVFFQLNSKTTHFQTYLHKISFLLLMWRSHSWSLFKNFRYILYTLVTSCNGKQLQWAVLCHELLQTFPSLQHDISLQAMFLMCFIYRQVQFTVFTVTLLSYCQIFMPTPPKHWLNSSSFFIIYYGTYTLPNGKQIHLNSLCSCIPRI